MSITQKELKKLVEYDPKGFLLWLVSPTNRVKVGSKLGSVGVDGYRKTFLKGKGYKVHRLVWLYHYGYFPESFVDHEDRDKSNNKIENLREVSNQCNIRNTGNYLSNSSGVKGVSWDSSANKWKVRVTVNRVTKYLGMSNSFIEAVCHRYAAEQCLDWSGCDSSSPAYKYLKENLWK